MKKTLLTLTMAGALLLLAACDSSSLVFDNNCTGNGMIQNPKYCTNTFHPDAGPYVKS